MIRRPPRSTQSRSSAASDVYKRQIKDSEINTKRVGIGSLVQVEDVENGSIKQEFRLVDPTESNPETGKISHLCPIGMSLMDSKLGDVVSVNTPGAVSYTHLRAHETR